MLQNELDNYILNRIWLYSRCNTVRSSFFFSTMKLRHIWIMAWTMLRLMLWIIWSSHKIKLNESSDTLQRIKLCRLCDTIFTFDQIQNNGKVVKIKLGSIFSTCEMRMRQILDWENNHFIPNELPTKRSLFHKHVFFLSLMMLLV